MQMRPPLAYQRSSKLHHANTACYRTAKFYSEWRKPYLDRCSLSEVAAGGDPWFWRCNFTTGRSPLCTTVPGGGARQPGWSPLAFPRSPLCNQAVTKSSARYISTSAFLEYKAVLFIKNLFLFVTMAPNLVQRYLSTISPDHFCLFFCSIFYISDFVYRWSALCYCKTQLLSSHGRPFVRKSRFSRTCQADWCQIWWKGRLPFHHISGQVLFIIQNFAFWFLRFFFRFRLHWTIWQKKNFKRHLPWKYPTDSLP